MFGALGQNFTGCSPFLMQTSVGGMTAI